MHPFNHTLCFPELISTRRWRSCLSWRTPILCMCWECVRVRNRCAWSSSTWSTETSTSSSLNTFQKVPSLKPPTPRLWGIELSLDPLSYFSPIELFLTHWAISHPLSYFSFQPVLHDWCNKGHGMYYPVLGMVHIKEPLLLIGKSSPCGGSWFPLSLSEWSFTICPTLYNRK